MGRPGTGVSAFTAVGSEAVVCCGPLQASLIKCHPALPSEAPSEGTKPWRDDGWQLVFTGRGGPTAVRYSPGLSRAPPAVPLEGDGDASVRPRANVGAFAGLGALGALGASALGFVG